MFITDGLPEDGEEGKTLGYIPCEEELNQVWQSLGNNPKVCIKTEYYSNLVHMDIPLISFTKGLQELLSSQ